MSDFTNLPDLALRTNRAGVIAASDESFEERENLINPWEPRFAEHTFGPKGQEYDGWETRRHRGPGHDWAVIRLGMPGVIRGVVVDTAWFKGNYPPFTSVEACRAPGYPSPAQLDSAEWVEIVPRTALGGDAKHELPVADDRIFTHVRLNIFPDGGVARLRVHGEVVPDPTLLTGLTVDLAALAHGARTIACSNMFYSAPDNMLAPGLARNQAEGWETARRRDGGNDWATIQLAAQGVPALIELDTTHLLFNAPGEARVVAIDHQGTGPLPPSDDPAWFELLPRTALQPDTPHRFRLAPSERAATHVRVDIYPDGGIARLRVFGALTAAAERELNSRWLSDGK
ncbi:allantoicase [Nocardia brasiliensis]|uniref:Probable allantoicase n=1 Tax=Nocardia brasiliensis (strain ATCC 700358 / HUJEG-1) TaxID=1133849 RepID=K0EWG1_NOCB7|nr:allantoicase [Nocardia brasiliensis]AFU01210.1 allantoicase [Nocardia brasiliensis ATCC 700358]OCF86572.1 allantoicase [Nocardia brasiliensis]